MRIVLIVLYLWVLYPITIYKIDIIINLHYNNCLNSRKLDESSICKVTALENIDEVMVQIVLLPSTIVLFVRVFVLSVEIISEPLM